VQFENFDIGSVKPIFHIPGSSPIYVSYVLSAQYLADRSDDDLWDWIGHVTGGKVLKPSGLDVLKFEGYGIEGEELI
jgi:hypothetical protein